MARKPYARRGFAGLGRPCSFAAAAADDDRSGRVFVARGPSWIHFCVPRRLFRSVWYPFWSVLGLWGSTLTLWVFILVHFGPFWGPPGPRGPRGARRRPRRKRGQDRRSFLVILERFGDHFKSLFGIIFVPFWGPFFDRFLVRPRRPPGSFWGRLLGAFCVKK